MWKQMDKEDGNSKFGVQKLEALPAVTNQAGTMTMSSSAMH